MYGKYWKRRYSFKYLIASLLLCISLILFWLLNNSVSKKDLQIQIQSQRQSQRQQLNEKLELGNVFTESVEHKIENKEISLYESIFEKIIENQPKVHIGSKSDITPVTGLTRDSLEKSIRYPDVFLKEVKRSVKLLVDYLNHNVDIEKVLEMNDDPEPGAVFLGGTENDSTWMSLISVSIFRKIGGTIPIEVMIPTRKEYLADKAICEKYLKSLNAHCVVVEDKLQLKTTGRILNNYSKIKRELAIISSRFSKMIVMTPDVMILKPIKETLFDFELFQKHGLITWSDLESRTTHPSFYDIINCKISDSVHSLKGFRLPKEAWQKGSTEDALHDFDGTLPYKSTCNDILMIDKSIHFKSVLLSLFYSYYLDGVFESLLSINGKASTETLIAAAQTLRLPYYQTNIEKQVTGSLYDGEFHTVGELYFDPNTDIISHNRYLEKMQNKAGYEINAHNYNVWLDESSSRKSALFLKVVERLTPVELFGKGVNLKPNGDRVKLFGKSVHFQKNFEVNLWKSINDYTCNYEIECDYLEKSFNSQPAELKAFCEHTMKPHMTWLSNF